MLTGTPIARNCFPARAKMPRSRDCAHGPGDLHVTPSRPVRPYSRFEFAPVLFIGPHHPSARPSQTPYAKHEIGRWIGRSAQQALIDGNTKAKALFEADAR